MTKKSKKAKRTVVRAPQAPRARRRSPHVDAAEVLTRHHGPRFSTFFIPEPHLLFAKRQSAVDPKTGLALFGPHDLAEPGRRQAVRLGLVGTGPLIDLTRSWIERSRSKVMPLFKRVNKDGSISLDPMDPQSHQPFPGFKEAFDAEFVVSEGLIETLSPIDIAPLNRIRLFEPRVKHLVDLLVSRLRVLADKPSPPDVVIVALPTDVRSLVNNPTKHLHTKKPRTRAPAIDQQDLLAGLVEPPPAEEVEREMSIFHHALKAYAMGPGIPTQLIWQKTLEGTATEDEATRAWNFWTGVYYKGGGVPWRVDGLQHGTCFVGISFYKDRQDGTLRSCLAQAFSDQGEGLVLRSEPFKWMGSKTPHLPKDVAADLITRVLEAYRDHVKNAPTRVVVHKWQRYWPEEREGFEQALASVVHSFDLVSFSDRGIRCFRAGQEPPLRGTMVQLGEGNCLLFTRGYVPYLGMYPGMRVPRPIEIVEHHGGAPLRQICHEVLALTKMDWNSAMFAGKEPITTAFSEDVGHILAELPVTATVRPQYRFYM